MYAIVRRYAGDHRHPVNRLCHAVAIPSLAVGASQLAFQWGLGWLTLGLLAGGVALLAAGHRVEGNRPVLLVMAWEAASGLLARLRARRRASITIG